MIKNLKKKIKAYKSKFTLRKKNAIKNKDELEKEKQEIKDYIEKEMQVW